jgi:uncharacterized protein YerC
MEVYINYLNFLNTPIFGTEICSFSDDISLSADGTDVLDHLKAAHRYREIPRTEGISTTALVSRILARINGATFQVSFE